MSCGVLAAVDDTRDLVGDEANRDGNPDVSAIWFTTTSASADATSYSDLESVTTPYAEIVLPSRQLPPIPVAYDDVAVDVSGSSGVISSEPQSGSEISSNISPSAPVGMTYSRPLTSFNRELPPAMSEYDKPTKRGYYNINNADGGAESGVVCDDSQNDSGMSSNTSPSSISASYSWLTASTREPPPTPSVYDKLGKHNYYNTPACR